MWEKTGTSGGRDVVSVIAVGTQRRHTGGVQECGFFFTQNKEESGPGDLPLTCLQTGGSCDPPLRHNYLLERLTELRETLTF